MGRLRNLDVQNKDPSYEYRWINDDPGRVHKLTVMDDWDVVTADGQPHDKDKGVGSAIERVVDKASGKRAILVRKPKDYYLADKAKEQAQIDDIDRQLKSGQPMAPEGLSGPTAYVPAGGISIRNGSKA